MGDELCVGVLGGLTGKGRITRLDSEALEMELSCSEAPPPPLPVTLLLALPRPKALKRVLVTATTLGIKRIILINASRVEKSFWGSPLLSAERIGAALVLGLEQARDTVMPEVVLKRRFKPFVEDELPALLPGALPLAAHPPAPVPCPCSVQRPVVAALGPEGGFIPYEVDMLRAAGFTAVSLGSRILRVEAALPFFMAKLF